MDRRQMKHTGSRAQRGFVLTFEAVLFATVMVLGTVVGLVNVRDSFNAELLDMATLIEGAIVLPYFSDPARGTGAAFMEQRFDYSVQPEGE